MFLSVFFLYACLIFFLFYFFVFFFFLCVLRVFFFFFFFKHKTAYEMRISDWSSDVCSSDLNEFGFDYLRDNMAWRKEDLVQRGHYFAIVDEVDSILIDEARTPLIISGPSSGEANRWFAEFAKIARTLEAGVDYEVDEKKRTIGVLEPGIEKVEDYLGIENLYESANTPLISFLNKSIKALALFKRDTDYVVMRSEEHTSELQSLMRISYA